VTLESEVRRFLDRWASASAARDPVASSDLYLRDPAPLVVFSDGERTDDWLDVRVRLERDFSRAFVDGVDVHDVDTRDLGQGVIVVSFEYDLHARDMWGVAASTARRATMTLIHTKEGLRIASAHYARDE
jgi:hypothetical protein